MNSAVDAKTRRVRRFVAVNNILIVTVVVYTVVLFFYDWEGVAGGDPYWVALLLSGGCFLIIKVIAARGHLLLAGRLWLVVFAALTLIHTLPYIEQYTLIFFLQMQLVIIGAGWFAGKGWGYAATVVITLMEILVMVFASLTLTFGSAAGVVIFNFLLAALVENSESDRLEFQRVGEKFETLLNHSPQAILLLDQAGFIITVNPQAVNLLGGMVGYMTGRYILKVLHVDDTATFQKALADVRRTQENARLEAIMPQPEGQAYDLDIHLIPLIDSQQIMVTINDVTALRETERLKDAMIASVTHELRTPLTSLQLYHDLLEKQPSKQAVYLEHLKRETMRLRYIIDEMLNMARIELNQLQPQRETIDMAVLLRQLMDDRRILSATHEVILDIPEGMLPPIDGDRLMLEQVFGVLLNNAINYSPQESTIVISMATEADHISVTVADAGPGISPADRPHIFKRFYRGQAAEANGKPGTGLGLPIAQAIVHKHDGDIIVSESASGGAQFSVQLPLSKKATPV